MAAYEDEMEVVSLQDLLDDARFEEAEHLLALVENDGVAWAASLRALCLRDLGRDDEAMSAAEHAIALEPGSAFGHWVVGALWCDRGHLERALASADEALRLDSGEPAHWALAAQVHAKRGRWQDCLEAADAGLARDPGDEACAGLRALALRGTNMGSDWSAELQRLTEQFPASAWARAGSGWGLLEAGRPRDARAAFEQALALDPTSTWARHGLQEAVKAQNPVYAALFRFFNRLQRLPPRTRWTIILGGMFGYRVLRNATRATPDLAIVTYPLMAAWVLFIALSWTAGPLSDFVLSRTHVGRRIVRGEDLVAANLIAGLLATAVTLASVSAIAHFERGLLSAMATGFLIIPVAAAFQCAPGWPRKTMSLYAGCVAVLVLVSFLAPTDAATAAFVAALVFAALGSWLGTFLASRTVKT